MIEIAIKIPDDIYEQAINGTEYDTLALGIKLRQSVQEGIVIPKGHGRLIDADGLLNSFELSDFDGDEYDCIDAACRIVGSMQTILEADKESEDE